jgi:nucleotide-binding universal stress UspA family protein
MFSKILVAYDGSNGSKRALGQAIALAAEGTHELTLISVIEDLPRYAEETLNDVDETLEHARSHFEFLQHAAAAQARERGVRVEGHIEPGHAVEAIVDFAARRGFDLVVIGGLGHSRLLRRIAGGAGGQIAYHAPCSVLVVR